MSMGSRSADAPTMTFHMPPSCITSTGRFVSVLTIPAMLIAFSRDEDANTCTLYTMPPVVAGVLMGGVVSSRTMGADEVTCTVRCFVHAPPYPLPRR